jgi:hypothetical protein
MRRERHLDLFGEDLLATGVDGLGVPAEEFDRAALEEPCAIPWDRIAVNSRMLW